MTDKPDYKKDKKANVKYEGYGQMGIIMLDIQFNAMEEGNGLAELAKPMYDKKMWDDDGALIQPPTFRAVADIVLDIVGNVTGHKWIGYIDDALFATLDLTGGYKTPAEVGLELGKKALTSAASYGISSLGSAAGAAASKALEGAGTAANVAAQAGISAAQSYATSVATNAINSVNIKDGKLDFDGKSFTKSLYSKDTIAGALSSGVNVAVTSGAQNFLLTDGNGIELTDNVFNTNALNTMAGLTGNAAAALTEYAISGHTTVNLINTSMFGLKTKDLKTGTLSTMHKGLFAVTFDSEEGVSSTISSAGFDMNLGNIATAMNGLHDITKITSTKVSSAFGGKEQISTLNAVNMLGYTNSNLNVSLANDIWQDRLGVEYGDTGDDYGNYTIGDSKIRLSDQLLGGGKEGSAKLAAVMSHEGTHAYGNRIEGYAHLAAADTYSQINYIFGLKGDSSFESQIVAGYYNPNNWKENEGDVDHWKIEYNNDGTIGWSWDKSFNFNFADGSSLTPEEMAEYIKAKKIEIEARRNGETLLSDANHETTHAEEVMGNAFLNYLGKNTIRPYLNAGNIFDAFIEGSEGFAEASIAATFLKNEIDKDKVNIESINKYTEEMGAALLTAQESGLLVKNSYGYIDTSNLIGEGNIAIPYFPLAGIAEGSSNPYINISSYEAWRINDVDMAAISTGSYILNEFSPFYHNGWDGVGSGNIVASLDGGLYLDYRNAEGFQVNNTTSLGNFETSHVSSSTVDQFFNLFGKQGVSLSNNNRYELNGIKAGTVIGFIGNTGSNTTGAHAHMSLNGSGDQFAKVFNTSYYDKYLKPTDYAIYMSGYKNPTLDNNQQLWVNVREYANRKPNKLSYNDFLNHNRDVYMNSIFWVKYPEFR